MGLKIKEKKEKIKQLKKQIEKIDKQLEIKRSENEELQHLLLKRLTSDIKAISKMLTPIVNGMGDIDDRLRKIEEKEIDEKIDNVINEYVQ